MGANLMKASNPSERWIHMVIMILGISGGAFALLLFFSTDAAVDPIAGAIVRMMMGLVLLWCVLGGLLMFRFRDAIRKQVQRIQLDWRITFVLFCTALALMEEGGTTRMTNLAPLFGVQMGEAAITASPNYLEVVLFHSVVVFIPMFIAWALMLWRWRFSASAVFLLFGLSGTLGESIAFGPQNLIGLGFWVFVYGLMVYLPAYSIPEARTARPPRWYHYPLALILPTLASIPVAIIILILRGPGS